MKKIHKIEQIRFVDNWMIINIDGQEHHFRLTDISSKLAAASEAERNYYRAMTSGYGIHWPLLDEDLSIDGLLGITHTPPRKVKRQQRKLQMA